MQEYNVLWSSTSNNRKTGNIPQGTIGSTKAAILESCNKAKCPLRPKTQGGNGECYAHSGTPAFAASSKTRAYQRGKDYTLDHALPNSARGANYVRLADIGDPCVLSRQQVDTIRQKAIAAGLKGQIGFTHAWQHAGKHLKGLLMASCDNPEQADQAVNEGWRAVVILNANAPTHGNKTPQGRRIIICPNQTKGIQCNDCGACDATRKGPIIGFRYHGKKQRSANGL